ncbi:hypothetical protein BBF96_08335 [Anoxybacter fermentans]|uniref:HEPN domain-containing protein n=1 Tax=Anoxybacter fermentans TaxID=1323375 RepID=A0A3Q9HSE0_9FIRM|nr:hypothetical protein [Anoxybacter fermentans]AZR73388.1 hypothetical protein BBF96_08335 [Anoxybacter fermentans]
MKDNYFEAYYFRLFDAKALMEKGRYEGAIYIGGYAVECLLKWAFKRLFGVSFMDFIKEIDGDNKVKYHNLEFLSTIIIEKIPSLKKNLTLRRNRLLEEWRPSFRYQGSLVHIFDKYGAGKGYRETIEVFCNDFLKEVEAFCNNVRRAVEEYEGRRRR